MVKATQGSAGGPLPTCRLSRPEQPCLTQNPRVQGPALTVISGRSLCPLEALFAHLRDGGGRPVGPAGSRRCHRLAQGWHKAPSGRCTSAKLLEGWTVPSGPTQPSGLSSSPGRTPQGQDPPPRPAPQGFLKSLWSLADFALGYWPTMGTQLMRFGVGTMWCTGHEGAFNPGLSKSRLKASRICSAPFQLGDLKQVTSPL